jgi:DNA-binding response OmpR family regulator
MNGTAKRILLVEDEPGIAEPLAALLRSEGFSVNAVGTSAAAFAAAAAETPDLVLLDWMLPDDPGVDLLKRWRQAQHAFPVIMLTARHELIDKVVGLELGADDYVTKPFEPRELVARIRARLRGAGSSAAVTPTLLAHAGIELAVETHTVRYDGRAVELTRMEYALLKLFLEHVGKVFTRDEILNKVWGFDAYPTTRTVDTHVLQLRQKLAPELFETVRGIGYRMKS